MFVLIIIKFILRIYDRTTPMYLQINPVVFSIGPISVYWYGIMYLVGFTSTWLLSMKRCQATCNPIDKNVVSDMLFYAATGIVIGGHLGYILIYELECFIEDPWIVLKICNGGISGMSFHGGLIGLILMIWLFCQKREYNVFDIFDFIAPMAPIGLGAGRLGNFINGELWGKVTDLPIGMVFPSGGIIPRYPSQLFEFLFEGIFLWIILFFLLTKQQPKLLISASFLLWYGTFRFIIEFLRQPDPQIGYLLLDCITMGQLLSLPMIITSLIILYTLKILNNQFKDSICNNT